MLTECSGWDYYLVLIFGPTAALAKVLPHGWVSPRPDNGTWLIEETDKGSTTHVVLVGASAPLLQIPFL